MAKITKLNPEPENQNFRIKQEKEIHKRELRRQDLQNDSSAWETTKDKRRLPWDFRIKKIWDIISLGVILLLAADVCHPFLDIERFQTLVVAITAMGGKKLLSGLKWFK